MSIICKAIEHKIELLPRAIHGDFRLAPPEFQGIEFGNVNLRLVVPGDPGVDGDSGVVERWFPWLRSLRQMKKDLLLAFDVGTSSVRAALVSETGKILAFAAKELEQVIPRFGWSQQSPRAWWEGLVFSVRGVLEKVANGADRVAGIAGCGQMHGVVLVDEAGELVLEEVPIWNDKRTRELVAQFCAEQDTKALLPIVGNPATVAWPAFKLAWIKQNLPKTYDAARTVLMPKDYMNFKLTHEYRFDLTEASSSYLFDIRTGGWSGKVLKVLGLDPAKLPLIAEATEVLGVVTREAAERTGLRAGTPVVVGAGDFPVALFGSGVTSPGTGCDITGTSTVITILSERPAADPIISNVRGIIGGWAAFTILDASGDVMRWARRTFRQHEPYTYEQMISLAEEVPAGADNLLFLPYLNGERLAYQPNSRAQFFGLTSRHTAAHLYRAAMEGVAFASNRNIDLMKSRGYRLDRMVSAAGGARTRLWLEIKASIYNTTILVPSEPECGVLGCAMLAGFAAGFFSSLESARADLVRYEGEVHPNPRWTERYQKLQSVFDDLYQSSEKFWDRLES